MRVAAIDCGTNSIRLLIADISNGNFHEVLRTMEIVRLGQGVDQNKAFHRNIVYKTNESTESPHETNQSSFLAMGKSPFEQ